MSPQQMIAHYRIVAKLGEGGMGAVYRATDTRLNREVAIKVLSGALADDPDYLARFAREAQVLALLNHPNIAIIHGVEEKALVMELVPGPTVEEIVAAGPIPLEEALGIAAQIAEALEAAHEKGITHRDLKPANVKVTPEGVVKVLDFGLAKAAGPASSVTAANSPTLTIRATQAGVIMGTAGYMAPEQAAGKPVDRRADIWSFGVVLHELLTGKRLFTGETVSHTLASVLKDPIDCNLPQAPAPIRLLLARCLTRNPKDRLRDIGEARIAIRSYLANSPAGNAAASQTTARGSSYWLLAALCAALSLSLVAALAWIFKPSPPLPIMRFAFTLGGDQALTTPNRGSLAISPDGTQMVYVANRRLYLHNMAEFEARPIAGTDSAEGATNPVFSPDGKSLAFLADSRALRRIAITGGAPVTIYSGGHNLLGLSWPDEGILLAEAERGILRVSPNGGEPELLVAAKGSETVAGPQLLPGGGAILFTISGNVGAPPRAAVQTLKSGARKTLVDAAMGARYLPTGHLVYLMNGILFAVPFNPRRLEISGSPVAIVEGVRPTAAAAHFAYSNTGTLIYIPGRVTSAGQNALARVGRNGEVEPLKLPPAAYGYPRVSKEGSRVAYQIQEGEESGIWVWDVAGDAAPRRLTLPGTGANRYPVWSSDGRRIAFQSNRDGDQGIWWQSADGNGAAEHLTAPGKGIADIPDSWSPGGQTFSFTREADKISEVFTYSLPEKKATVFTSGPGTLVGSSVFSPDGHWVAYQSRSEPGSHVYVRPFPPTATVYVAPQDGDAHHPVWSPDGKELFYIAGDGQAGTIRFTSTPGVSFGSPVRMAQSGFSTAPPAAVRTFDVFPDGQHFIGVVAAGQTQFSPIGSQIQVVLNWFEDVKQRAPAK